MGSSAVVIADKDGGRMTELRANGDIPVFESPSGDRIFWRESVLITGSGDNTIHTPGTGKKFYVDTIHLSVRQASDLSLKSGTTNLTGPMSLAANGALSVSHADVKLAGRAIENAFVISTSGDYYNPYVGGWVTGYDE